MHAAWEPHPGQRLLLHALFVQGRKLVVCRAGRKFGKSDMCAYASSIKAGLNRDGQNYIVAPTMKACAELYWHNRRLPDFLLPRPSVMPDRAQAGAAMARADARWVDSKRRHEYRLCLRNGSFVKLEGADNPDSDRGLNPDFVAVEEGKDHRPRYLLNMRPNLLAKNAPLLSIGTGSVGHEPGADQWKELQQEAREAEYGAFFTFPSWINHHVPQEFLEREKWRLLNAGRATEWEREYLGLDVPETERMVFPMFGDAHLVDHAALKEEMSRDPKDWDWWVGIDPASSSCFAVVLAALHRMDKRIRVVGEIYETNPTLMHTRGMWERAKRLAGEEGPGIGECRVVYDSAARWFANEVSQLGGGRPEPSKKVPRKAGELGANSPERSKEDGISMLRDVMSRDGLFAVSGACRRLAGELREYRYDERHRPVKAGDHGIDALRYVLRNAWYSPRPAKGVEPSWADSSVDEREAAVKRARRRRFDDSFWE